MIATIWNHFHWNITALPAALPLLKEPFSVRRARPEEKEAVRAVALYALKMNTDWHDATEVAADAIERGVDLAFSPDAEPTCFVIAHGARVVGISIVDLNPEAVQQIITGPWVMMEYRNRGFGTALLHASLEELAHRGITQAHGITRKNSVAARFVYPKFGGMMSDDAVPVAIATHA